MKWQVEERERGWQRDSNNRLITNRTRYNAAAVLLR